MRKAFLKRAADWLEKTSVAAFAVGIFQGKAIGLVVAATAFVLSVLLTRNREDA